LDEAAILRDATGAKKKMTEGKSESAARLRRKAEKMAVAEKTGNRGMSQADMKELVHELEVHQIELGLQNEELRRVQQELQTSRDRYADLFEFAPVGYFALDQNFQILEANFAGSQILNMERSLLSGRCFTDYVQPECRDRFRSMFKAGCIETGGGCEIKMRRQEGALFFAELQVAEKTASGADAGYRMALIDITERKRMETELAMHRALVEARTDELKKANEDLKRQAAQLRALAGELTRSEQRERRRLAKILHDHLQQLLVAAKFRAEILDQSGDKITKQAASEIADLIGECVTESRSLTSELSPPILHEGGLAEILEWLTHMMANKHGLIVNLSTENGLPSLIEDVKILLFESVRELLFNAVKHAHVGSAHINVRQVEDREIRITVSDNGPGFEPADLNKVVEIGSGFGLFSIRERLEMIGGRMEIDSTPGRGARFILRVPFDKAIAAPMPVFEVAPQQAPAMRTEEAGLPKQGNPIRVLLADDHTVVREGLVRLLGNVPDIEVVGEAADGQEAMELAQKLLPDVILMDVSMPKLNGVEATRAIHNCYPDIRIIGLSMFEESDRMHAVRDAGAVDYLTKSGPSKAIINSIRACVQTNPSL
jgi:PAS domain S-box-containing protein